jgi:protein TonB
VAYQYSIDDPARNSKRTLAFVLVVIIHVLFFWVLATGLGAKVVEVVMGPVETKIIEEKPDEEKPPPPPPEIDTPPPYVPPPELAIEVPVESNTTAITNVTTERPVAAPPPVAAAPKPVEKEVVRIPPSTQGRGARITQPEYPPSSRRAGEEGTVTLTVFVQADGRPGEIKIAKSSGFEKLDDAAVKEVKRNWRFVPGKEDGKPVGMWHTFAVTFRLTD